MALLIYKYKDKGFSSTEYHARTIRAFITDNKELCIEISNYYEDFIEDSPPESRECWLCLPREEAVGLAKTILSHLGE